MNTQFILYSTFIVLISNFILYYVGKKVGKKEIKNRLSKGTGRMGIIRIFENGWSDGGRGFIEVEELESAGENTKVKIHNVIPDRDSGVKSERNLLKKWGGNDWVKTKDITWYDNNSQKIRDAKLKSILNES